MILRFLGPDGGTTSDAIASLQYAVANGATVSNNSWGGGPYSQALYDAIKAAGDAGHIFVAAAGNSYNNNDTFPRYPASYDLDNIIAVAATLTTSSRLPRRETATTLPAFRTTAEPVSTWVHRASTLSVPTGTRKRRLMTIGTAAARRWLRRT
jgi:hypothetical protein